MRISVCEFLRLSTNIAWFYHRPGVWVSDAWAFEAHRDSNDEDVLHIIYAKTREHKKTLTYWAGPTSHVTRAKNQKDKKK
jgi:hypothetical protein